MLDLMVEAIFGEFSKYNGCLTFNQGEAQLQKFISP